VLPARSDPSPNPPATEAHHASGVLLKDEAHTRVELLATVDGPVFRKTYRLSGLRRLRTFLSRSKAAREFANLQRLHDVGIAATEPLDWGETRRLGFVTSAFVDTRWIPSAVDLRRLLADRSPTTATNMHSRRQLATAYGALAASLHRHGLLSSTLQPRNLVGLDGGLEGGQRCELLLCDQPSLMDFGRGIHGGRLAWIDLFDIAFSPPRCRDFSKTERLRLLRAYTGEDRELLRRLWNKLTRRPAWLHQVLRELLRGLFVQLRLVR
jgi:hypothetical protein